MEFQYFYRLDTLQIDAVYHDSKTTSSVFKDPAVYVEVNVSDPPYEVSRNHKVVLDGEGQVVDSTPFENPVQPQPTVELPPNPGYAVIIGADLQAEKPLQVRRTYMGQDFTFWCYVTQDLKDLYDAGNLGLGDVVSLVYIDGDVEMALAQQKVFKTW